MVSGGQVKAILRFGGRSGLLWRPPTPCSDEGEVAQNLEEVARAIVRVRGPNGHSLSLRAWLNEELM
eukprot:394282-Pyramimonas_sp.AAC.1